MEETKPESYTCGHPVKAVIINTTEESLATYFEWKKSKSTYFEWKNSKSDLCLDCWMKERNKL